MDERNFEQKLERLLKQDFSAGTEEFRDSLLLRCVEELDSSEHDHDERFHAFEIPDDDLELLSAAGDILRDLRK